MLWCWWDLNASHWKTWPRCSVSADVAARGAGGNTSGVAACGGVAGGVAVTR